MFNVRLNTSAPGFHVSGEKGVPGFNVGRDTAVGRGASNAFDLPNRMLNPYVPWLQLPTAGDDPGYPPADMNAYAFGTVPDFVGSYPPASYSPNSTP